MIELEELTVPEGFRDWWNQEHAPLPELPEEEFEVWGIRVGNAYSFASWKAVDWAAEARERGYEYDRIASILGRPEGSCRSLVKIGRAFPRVSRRYNLGPSFYDAAKALPEGDRDTVLSQAVEQSYTRDQFRAFVGEFKRLRGIPEDPKPEQPQWNNGNGGRFGAGADKAETQQTEPCIDDAEHTVAETSYSLPPDSEDLSDLVPEGKTGVCKCGHVVHLHSSSGCVMCREECEEYEFAEWLDDTHCHAGGPEVQQEPYVHDLRGSIPDLAPSMSQQFKDLEAEVESLRAKLAGTVLSVPYDLEEMIKVEVDFRQKREPRDATIDFESVGLLALRRGLKVLASDQGRKR